MSQHSYFRSSQYIPLLKQKLPNSSCIGIHLPFHLQVHGQSLAPSYRATSPFVWPPIEMGSRLLPCADLCHCPAQSQGWWLWPFLLTPVLMTYLLLAAEYLSLLLFRVRMGRKTVWWLWRPCSASCFLCADWWWAAQPPSRTKLHTVTPAAAPISPLWKCQQCLFVAPFQNLTAHVSNPSLSTSWETLSA